jgi:hypothetical protein
MLVIAREDVKNGINIGDEGQVRMRECVDVGVSPNLLTNRLYSRPLHDLHQNRLGDVHRRVRQTSIIRTIRKNALASISFQCESSS